MAKVKKWFFPLSHLREPFVPGLMPSKRYCISVKDGVKLVMPSLIALPFAKRPEDVCEFVKAGVKPPMSQYSSGSITDRTLALIPLISVLKGHLTDEQIKTNGDKTESMEGMR